MLRPPWLKLLPLAVAALLFLLGAGAPAGAWIGLRTGNAPGGPGLVWERPGPGSIAWTASFVLNRGYSGVHLEVGTKWYARSALRGAFVHLALASGAGRTGAAAWASLQLSAGLGYAWALTDRARAVFEAGRAVRTVRATSTDGRVFYSRSVQPLVHIGLLWRF